MKCTNHEKYKYAGHKTNANVLFNEVLSYC